VARGRTIGQDGGAAATILVALAGFAYLLIAPSTLSDGDTGWHLATGRWILAHGRVPTTDPFSYTAPGHPWVAHEWLSEIAMYAAWRAAGWSGLIVLTATAFAGMLAIVGWHARRWLSAGGVAVALALLAMVLMPALLARPHVLALPLLAAWIVVLLRAREADRAPPLGWAALMLVWANAHGSFMFGLALVAAFALDALVTAAPDRRRAAVVHWGAFGALSGLAALATPGGVHGFLYPLYVGSLALLPYIQEWHPVDVGRLDTFQIAVAASLFVLLVRPTRIAPIRLVLLLGTLHLALAHVRQVSVFVLLATLVLAEPIGRAWTDGSLPRSRGPRRGTRSLAAIALAIALVLATARLVVPATRADSEGVPDTALRHLPASLKSRRVFNEYSFGGPLILAGVRPFIDGRSDMYGDAFSIDYFRMVSGDWDRWRAADRRWRFGWTMLAPADPLVRHLDAEPAWRRLYADEVAVMHVRR